MLFLYSNGKKFKRLLLKLFYKQQKLDERLHLASIETYENERERGGHSRLFQKRLCKNLFLRSSMYQKYFNGFLIAVSNP